MLGYTVLGSVLAADRMVIAAERSVAADKVAAERSEVATVLAPAADRIVLS